MHYIESFDRNQMMMTTWDSMVDSESTAKLIDAFVDSLDLSKYGVKEIAPEGRPPYDPRSLYKLYIYGSDNGIKSSRKLAKSCKVNVEVKWHASRFSSPNCLLGPTDFMMRSVWSWRSRLWSG